MRRLLLGLMLLLPAVARADYISDYREGVAAAERQQWDRVDTLMRSAMAQEPNPKQRIRLYGQVFVPYVPKFYLGLAAFSRKDCKTAMSLLEDAVHSNVMRGQRLEERQQMMLRSCRAQLAQAAPPAAAPATAPGQTPAQVAAPAATPPPAASPAAPKPTPAAPPPAAAPVFDGARAQAAQARLDRVDAALATALRTLADPALAAARSNWQRQADPLSAQAARTRAALGSARQARDAAALSAIEAQLAALQPSVDSLAQGIESARVSARGAVLADARSALERAIGQAETQLAASSDRNTPAAQALVQALAQGRANLGAADGARLQAALQTIEAASRGLDLAQARSALAAQVRGRLQPLAAAYLGGDFARAAQWNDEQALQSVPQAHAEALLLRAAARYELYVLGGERDLAQFDLIRADVRAARRLWAAIEPSERAFSPRFRSLFASTR